MPQWIWVVVVVVSVAVLLGLAVAVVARRRGRRTLETHAFPANYLEPYGRRVDELERMFVNQPREAVAAAKLLVDDMLTRMGYPVRMTNEERVRDLRQVDKERSERYALATNFKGEPSTEQMRRALQAHLETARALLDDTRKHHGATVADQPAASRELAG